MDARCRNDDCLQGQPTTTRRENDGRLDGSQARDYHHSGQTARQHRYGRQIIRIPRSCKGIVLRPLRGEKHRCRRVGESREVKRCQRRVGLFVYAGRPRDKRRLRWCVQLRCQRQVREGHQRQIRHEARQAGPCGLLLAEGRR